MKSTTSIRALLVEDDPAHARLVLELFTEVPELEIHLDRAGSLARAVDHLKGEEADLVLLDLNLPDARGPEAVQEVREADPHVPVLVLTGYPDDDLSLECLRAGADDFVPKDELSPDVLARTVRYAVGRGHQVQMRALHRSVERARARARARALAAGTETPAPLRQVAPATAEELEEEYVQLLERYVEDARGEEILLPDELARTADHLVDLGATSRDVHELHAATLARVASGATTLELVEVNRQGPFLLAETLGLLVDGYRSRTRLRTT